MRRCLLFIFFLGLSFTTFCQELEPIEPRKDKLEFKGYIIRILPSAAGTYGYSISREEKVLLYQPHNPFTPVPMGLGKKEDVYKVAKWQINRVKPNETKPPVVKGKMDSGAKRRARPSADVHLSLQLPISVANELQINFPR